MPSRPLAPVSLGVVFLAFAAGQQPYSSPEEELPRRVGPQPVAFSHAAHAANRIVCRDCHPGAADRERAGLPGRDDCMLCHGVIAADRAAIQRLAALPAGRPIAWERVYEVPGFVFFSHSEHVLAGLGCEQCHGSVADREVLSQEVSVNMVSCMNCHASRNVSNECFLCHDLGQ